MWVTNPTGTIFWMKSSSRIQALNNTFNGGDYAIVLDNPAAFQQLNHNNYYLSEGEAVFGSFSTTYSNLSQWQQFSGKDLQSHNVNGTGFSTDPGNFAFSNLGVYCGITVDYAGKPRKTPPDIGALEFDLVDRNLRLSGTYYSFGQNICPGYDSVRITLINEGLLTLDSILLTVTINSETFEIRRLVPLPSQGIAENLGLMPYNFQPRKSYSIIISAEFIGNYKDQYPVNNKFVSYGLKTAMTGSYTVGEYKCDFKDLIAASDTLDVYGICDTVHLKLSEGHHFPGAAFKDINKNGNGWLVIESGSGHSEFCRLQGSIGLTDCKNVIIRNINFFGYTEHNGIYIYDVFKNIYIEGNKFVLDSNAFKGMSSQRYYIRRSTSSQYKTGSNLYVRNNQFWNSMVGIDISSYYSRFDSNIVVSHNKFEQVYSSAINLRYVRDFVIENNQIHTNCDSFRIWPIGNIILHMVRSGLVSGNVVTGRFNHSLAVYKPSSLDSILIENNYFASLNEGIEFTEVGNLNFRWNTVRGKAGASGLIRFTLPISFSISNNIIACSDTGKVYSILPSGLRSSYNIFSTDSLITGPSNPSLASLQATGKEVQSRHLKLNFPSPIHYTFDTDSSHLLTGDSLNRPLTDLLGNPRVNSSIRGCVENSGNTRIPVHFKVNLDSASCRTEPLLRLTLINLSQSDTIKSYRLKLRMNGMDKMEPIWSGLIAPGDTLKDYPIAYYLFSYSKPESFEAQLLSLNGQLPDTNSTTVYFVPASQHPFYGTYQLRGGKGVFMDFYETTKALYHSGMCGNVHIQAVGGVYEDGIYLNGEIPGKQEDTLFIRGEISDSSLVKLKGGTVPIIPYFSTCQLYLNNIRNIHVSGIYLTSQTLIDTNAHQTNLESILFSKRVRIHGRECSIHHNLFEDEVFVTNAGKVRFWSNSFFHPSQNNSFISGCDSITFENNAFFYHRINSSNTHNLLIENNRFYGGNTEVLYLQRTAQLRVEKNEFILGTVRVGDLYQAMDSVRIFNNGFIYKSGYQVQLLDLIRLNKPEIAHNTFQFEIKLPETGYKLYAIRFRDVDSATVINNLISKKTDSNYCYLNEYFNGDTASSFLRFDHNVYHSNCSLSNGFYFEQNDITSPIGTKLSFQAWNTLGFDLNSKQTQLYFEPFVFSPSNVFPIPGGGKPTYSYRINENHPERPFSQLFLPEVSTDIAENQRDSLTPLAGCQEVPAFHRNNVYFLGLENHASNPCSDSVYLRTSNAGIDTIRHLEVSARIGNTVLNLVITPKIAPGDTALVALYFPKSYLGIIPYEIYPLQVNNLPDEYAVLDTLKGNYFVPIQGTFTVGKPDSDFPLLAQAIETVNLHGICDDVELILEDGIYLGGLELENFYRGRDDLNFTLRSRSGDPEKTRFNQVKNYRYQHLFINGPKNVAIEGIGFSNEIVNFTLTSGIVIWNGASNIQITNCHFEAFEDYYKMENGITTHGNYPPALGNTDFLDISDIRVTNCVFKGFDAGVFLSALGGPKGTVADVYIAKNSFLDCIHGIRLILVQNASIQNNFSNTHHGFSVSMAKGPLRIEKNIIQVQFNALSLDLRNTPDTTFVLNNQILSNDYSFGLNHSPLLVVQGGNSLVAHNTFHHGNLAYDYTRADTLEVSFVRIMHDIKELRIYNNVFSSLYPTEFLYFLDTTGSILSNENVFKVSSNVYVSYQHGNTDTQKSLSQWKAESQQDANSQYLDPQYTALPYLRIGNQGVRPSAIKLNAVSHDYFGIKRAAQPMPGCFELNGSLDYRIDSASINKACIGNSDIVVHLSANEPVSGDTLVMEVFKGNTVFARFLKPITFSSLPYSNSHSMSVALPPLNQGDSLGVRIFPKSGIPDLNIWNDGFMLKIPQQGGQSSLLMDSVLACNGAPVTLFPGTFASYLWSDGSTSATYSSFGNETITVRLESIDGCVLSDTIRVGTGTGASIDLPLDTTLCRNEPLYFTNSLFKETHWMENGLPEILPENKVWYTLFALDNNACSSSDSIYVELSPGTPLQLDSVYFYCLGDSVNIDAGNFASYYWFDGNTAAQHSISVKGSYYVSVSDNGNCFQKDDFTVEELALPAVPSIVKSFDTLFVSGTGMLGLNWYLNGTGISNANDTFWVMQQNGTYQIEVTSNEGCVALSNPYIGVMSLNSIETNQYCQVYPNPTERWLKITFLHNDPMPSMQIINLLGQSLSVPINRFNETSWTMDLESLSPGTYLLRIQTPGHTDTFQYQVIKTH
ncbi:MAG TPA: hypothetical protein DIW47_10945 [Bacteroidetes bacterium]|nr:hypothetical protein [Bacteroidota bacterium]